MRKAMMNAAVLVAVISALIVLYILFLPSEDRLDIIGENETNRDFGDRKQDILLEDTGLVMEHFGDDEIDHILPSLTLYSTSSATIIREIAAFSVSKSLFSDTSQEIDFSFDDVDQASNGLASFVVKKGKGNLRVDLNGKNIFNGEIDAANPEPIALPKELLSEDNVLVFTVSGPGIAFWSKNEYGIENFRVTANILDTTGQSAKVDFYVGKEEAGHIEKATLRFVPDCDTRTGVLDIKINDKLTYSSIPDCGVPRPLQFDPNLLVEGENTLEFSTNKGRYLIDQIKVTSELEEIPSFTYFFDVDSDQFKDIKDGRKTANLTLYFTDDTEDKAAEIVINDRKTFMTRHEEFEWSIILDRYLESGSNSLKIIPDTRLEVRRLEVVLDDD